MSSMLPPCDEELFGRCSEVLHYIWDPIGVAGTPEARDEYDSYIPPILSRVVENKSISEIAGVLDRFVSEQMQIAPDRAKSQEVARILLDWKDLINERVARDIVDGP